MRRVALASLVLSLVACSEDVDSTDVKTSGVYADMNVLAPGDGTSTVTADLRVGGSASNTHLQMKGPDQLTATSGTQSVAMTQNGTLYQAALTGDVGGTKFVVAFTRGEDDKSAPNSNATLPATFTLMGMDRGQIVSRTLGVTVSWVVSPEAEGGMQWAVEGDCLFRTGNDISDSGTLTLTTTEFSVKPGDEAKRCTASLCIDRWRYGLVDPNFGEGGKFIARQQRCIPFNSDP